MCDADARCNNAAVIAYKTSDVGIKSARQKQAVVNGDSKKRD